MKSVPPIRGTAETIQKEIIVLGDIEMGGGTLTDDFISDQALSSLLQSLTLRKYPLDLILNGDTFDFLKCPYVEPSGEHSYPRHITAEISLAKLKLIYAAHQPVFDALARFLKTKKNKVFFIIGNHDHDLFFPGVQKEIQRLLGRTKNIFFCLYYQSDKVYVEHGHQYDFLNKISPRHLFLDYQGKRILNIPWVSFGLISRFMYIKEENPFLERIKPVQLLFTHHRGILRKLTIHSSLYFLKSFLYYPFRYYGDPTYAYPKAVVREIYRRIMKVHWEVDEIVRVFKRQRKKKLSEHRVYVLGHKHKKYLEEKDGWTIIHPDTWRDEYTLDAETNQLTAKPKMYVQVKVINNDPRYALVNVPITRSIWPFEEVVKDELRYIKLAAAEENFRLRLQLRRTERP